MALQLTDFVRVLLFLLFTSLFYIPAAADPNLPSPTGPYSVGRLNLTLLDHDRLVDPLAPTAGVPGVDFPDGRYVPLYIYYPTNASDGEQAPYVNGLKQAQFLDEFLMVPPGTFENITTNSFIDAPIHLLPPKTSHEGPEIILYSPAYGLNSLYFTTMHEELASWGYVVIAMNHPYDSDFITLPGVNDTIDVDPLYNVLDNKCNTFNATNAQIDELINARIDDTRFILRSLGDPKSDLTQAVESHMKSSKRKRTTATTATSAKEPAQKTKIDRRLSSRSDTPVNWWSRYARVGMYGHGLGGSIATTTIILHDPDYDYPPVRGALNIEGTLAPSYLNDSNPGNYTGRPFLYWSSTNGTDITTTGYEFSSNITMSPLFYYVVGKFTFATIWNKFQFLTFTDAPALMKTDVPESSPVREYLGKVDGEKATAEMREIGTAFFDWALRGDSFAALIAAGETDFEGKDVFTIPRY